MTLLATLLGATKSNPIAGLLPFVVIFAAMYFLMIRPRQRQMRAQREQMSAIAEGDEVVTSSGIYGFVTAVEGDIMWLEIADGIDVRISKSAVARRVAAPVTAADAQASSTDAEPIDGDQPDEKP
jgi:preprotein translocase subunit YajC